ncbi:MAG: DUF3418 domain-containing protein [Phycisphaeraceae bacterium]|nr:DUF3418 domain-containing protein [Phycisphaeraceae bacterium]
MSHWLRDPVLRRDLDRVMLVDWFRLRARARGLVAQHSDSPPVTWREELARAVARIEDREAHVPRPDYPTDLPVVQRRDDILRAILEHQVVVVCGETGSGKTTQLPKLCLEAGRGRQGIIGHTQPRRIAARSVAARIAEELGLQVGNGVGYKVRFTDLSGQGRRPRAETGTGASRPRHHHTPYIKVMTDGILLAETQGDRLLAHYDTLIIDEAHERSLNIDFLLGYIRNLLDSGKRPDLKVIITSATIDPERFKRFFEGAPVVAAAAATADPTARSSAPVQSTSTPSSAPSPPSSSASSSLRASAPLREVASSPRATPTVPILEVSGRTFPVEVRYRPPEEREDDDLNPVQRGVVEAVREITSPETPTHGSARDILVFLSGEREIREMADILRRHLPRVGEVLPLFARLTNEEQDRVFRPTTGGTRRIVLATNVAETSLTVPGIGFVVDAGLARISRYSPRVKVQRLPIESISQASANQRSGRCGRIAPGIAIRLYAQDDYERRARFTEPEILRTNLASAILQMKALGLGRIERFPLIDRPDERLVHDGYDTLLEIGAVDDRGEITPIGRELARLPIDPRIGRMILAARHAGPGVLADVLVIAAALSVQDPRERPIDRSEAADAAHSEFRDERSDFISWLKLWGAWQKAQGELSSSRLRKWCRERFLNFMRMREWQDVWRQLSHLEQRGHQAAGATALPSQGSARPMRGARSTGLGGVDEGGRGGHGRGETRQRGTPRDIEGEARYAAIHKALLAGLLSNIGRKSDKPPGFEYDGTRALKFYVFPGSGLFKKQPKWIMAAELVRTTRLYARTCAAIDPRWIEEVAAPLAGHLLKKTHSDAHWRSDIAQVEANERVSLLGLDIVKRRPVHYGPIDPPTSRALFIHHALVMGEYLTEGEFFRHNHDLAKRIADLEARTRKQGLLRDATARFNFYDQRIGDDVYSGPGFERWRRKAEARDPRLLFMTMDDLLAPDFAAPPEGAFPDRYAFTGAGGDRLNLRLEYTYEPGAPADGVSITIPLAQAWSFDPRPLEWLVPGMLREKTIELIRTLPKSLRASFAPAPQFADAALKDLPFGKGDLLEVLASRLSRLAGVVVHAAAWNPAQLPPHLRANFRVVDEAGAEVAGGREWAEVLRRLEQRRAEAVRALSRGPFSRDDVRTWDFGSPPLHELEEEITIGGGDAGGAAGLRAYPALTEEEGVDGHRRAALRLFDTRAAADAAMRDGLKRLLLIQVREQVRSLIEHRPGIQRVRLLYAGMDRPDRFLDEMTEVVGTRVFGPDQNPRSPVPLLLAPAHEVRSKLAFEKRLDAGWGQLGRAADDSCALVEEFLKEHQPLALALAAAGPPAWDQAMADMREQFSRLVYPGVLSATPWRVLSRLPVYLRAMRLRLERLAADPPHSVARDAQKMAEVAPFWRAWLEADAAHAAAVREGKGDRSRPPPAEFRWLIEEFRVSLFAQELRAAVPVSSKRLLAAWESAAKDN